MKCINCGFETEETFEFCPNCGNAANAEPVPTEAVSINPAADKVLSIIKDGMFLAICILMSAVVALSVIDGSIPVFQILFTIFLWLVYAQSRKGIADAKYLRYVSGTVFAQYVVNYVLFGFVIFAGILVGFFFNIIASNPELLDELNVELNILGESYVDIEEVFTALSGWVLMAIFVIAGIIGIIINFFALGKIHKLAKSVYQSIECNAILFDCVNAAKNWMFVLGVCNAVSALSSLGDGDMPVVLSNAASAAMQILAGILIKKHLSAPVQPTEQI